MLHRTIIAVAVAVAVALALGAAVVQAQSTPQPKSLTVKEVIETTGSFVFSDGASLYRFAKDGSFELGPLGISGRTVEGRWKTDDYAHFAIVGRWAWVNGLSRDDDYRRLAVHISYHGDAAVESASISQTLVYPCYFTIEALAPITKAEHDAGP